MCLRHWFTVDDQEIPSGRRQSGGLPPRCKREWLPFSHVSHRRDACVSVNRPIANRLLLRTAVLVLTLNVLPGVAADGNLITPDPAVPRPPYAVSQAFIAFQSDINRMNDQRVSDGDPPWFARALETGKGKVQLIAHPTWVKAPIKDRQSSLQLMVNLWSLRTGLDKGILLIISDANGIPLMHGSR